MLLIIDSGSTKNSWALCSKEGTAYTDGPGMHPAFYTDEDLLANIHKGLPKNADPKLVTKVHYFGSGCLQTKPAERIQALLSEVFVNAFVLVRSDLEGAALACLGRKSGRIAILGTGSSAALWGGESLEMVAPSLGYLLGDEGSGADLVKTILKAIFYKNIDESISAAFQDYDKRDRSSIIRSVQTAQHPGKALASYVAFISQHKEHPQVKDLVRECFKTFLKTQVLSLPGNDSIIHFCGGVAFEFSALLTDACNEMRLEVGSIIKAPLNSLVKFYCD